MATFDDKESSFGGANNQSDDCVSFSNNDVVDIIVSTHETKAVPNGPIGMALGRLSATES
jgi:hypothetical protein